VLAGGGEQLLVAAEVSDTKKSDLIIGEPAEPGR